MSIFGEVTYYGRQATQQCRNAIIRQYERSIAYMNPRYQNIIALSGPTGVGKTTLACELVQLIGALHVSTSSLISSIRPALPPGRASLQQAGNSLDEETDFRWIASEVSKLEREFPGRSLVVDAVRKPQQVLALREQATLNLTHIHLEAGYDHLVHRHSLRSRDIDTGQSYDVLVKDVSESYKSDLARISDLTLDAENKSPSQLAKKVMSFLGVAVTDTA